MNFKDSQTCRNLANAFAGESQARNRYTFFSETARKEGHQHIAAVFIETAENEREHAKVFYKLLNSLMQGASNLIHVDADYPLVYNDTLTNLRSAAEGEREEWQVVYSKFAEDAKQEGFAEAERAFRYIAEVEKHHMERFTKLADGLQQGNLYKKEGQVQWKCTNCGYVHVGPEAPGACPACAHPQGYFEEIPQQY